MKSTFFVVLGLAGPLPAIAQETIYPSKFSPELAATPAVQDALRYIDEQFEHQVQEWIRITEIPAKSQHEQRRAEYLRTQLEALDLDVTIDSIGNVVAHRPGRAHARRLQSGHGADRRLAARESEGLWESVSVSGAGRRRHPPGAA